jgi:hypothetical protein
MAVEADHEGRHEGPGRSSGAYERCMETTIRLMKSDDEDRVAHET